MSVASSEWDPTWQTEPPTDDGGPEHQGGLWLLLDRPTSNLLEHGFLMCSHADVFLSKIEAVRHLVFQRMVNDEPPLTWKNTSPWHVQAWDNTGDFEDDSCEHFMIVHHHVPDWDGDDPTDFPEIVAAMLRRYPSLAGEGIWKA